MNLWQRLEKRGRTELRLNDDWHLFAADLSETENIAEIKFAKKIGSKYMSDNDIVGYVKYLDLR
jgi:ribosomal protein L15